MRRIRIAIFVLLCLLIVFAVCFEAYRLRQLHRAETLLQILRSQALAEQFNDADLSQFPVELRSCDSAHECSTYYSVWSFPRRWSSKKEPPDIWPFRTWKVTASVQRDAAGRVLQTDFVVYQDRGQRRHEVMLHYFRAGSYSATIGRLGCGEGGALAESAHPGLFEIRHPWYRTIYTDVLWTAPVASKDEAFRLKLACLESLRGCSSPDAIAPEAARRIEQDFEWEKNHKAELERWNIEHCGRPEYYIGWK